MNTRVILGAGMAGFGAAHRYKQEGLNSVLFDKNSYYGGHAASFHHEGGWIFDDGPHISFTKNERMQKLFANSVDQKYEVLDTQVNNYWKGHWPKHPVVCNLHGLPTDLVVNAISDFVAASNNEDPVITNYEDWLRASYGDTLARTFPMEYGLKYHTTTADNMTTDWLGSRLYRPKLEEVLQGALTPETPNYHYISHFRYPTFSGFSNYFTGFLSDAEIRLNHELVELDYKERRLSFKNGETISYDSLVSSIPLPKLVQLIKNVPEEVRLAASKLAWTQCVVVNLGLSRENISKAHWTYFYDRDISFARLSFPHMLSPNTVPKGCGAIQAEVYFSEKYKPLNQSPSELIPRVKEDLVKCGLIEKDEATVFEEATIAPYAQIIFDLERKEALSIVHGFLEEIGVAYAGRYGEWGYLWTDESFMSGEKAAEKTL